MSSDPRLRIIVLGTGSAGNATVVTNGETALLVDCGFSAREVSRRLDSAGIGAVDIAGVLLTHEHSDHVRGVDVFVRRHAHSCSIYATGGTLSEASGLERVEERTRRIRAGEPFVVNGITVTAFSTSHDAAQPVGYRFESGGDAVGVATDTGILTPETAEALAGCRLIGLECNHDLEMLANGPYPAYLKRRIRSHAGHLSNEDAAAAIEKLAHNGLTHVIALHRSRTNNTARLAGNALKSRLAIIGHNAAVTVAAQDEICDSDPPQQQLFEV